MKVFPAPVAPYTKQLQLNPLITELTNGFVHRSKTSWFVDSSLKTLSKSKMSIQRSTEAVILFVTKLTHCELLLLPSSNVSVSLLCAMKKELIFIWIWIKYKRFFIKNSDDRFLIIFLEIWKTNGLKWDFNSKFQNQLPFRADWKAEPEQRPSSPLHSLFLSIL